MAARRISQTAINWAQLAERVPPNQKASFINFKTKSDAYLRAVLANPENPPKIDWDNYKKLVPIPGLVDKFQQQYSAVKVPFPSDNVTSQVEAQAKETKSEIEKFKADSNSRISTHEKEIAHLQSLIPYSEMTMEEFRDAHPDVALDSINRPTFWPHTPDEQLDYKSKDEAAHGH